jgi:hypothetical protein
MYKIFKEIFPLETNLLGASRKTKTLVIIVVMKDIRGEIAKNTLQP